MRSCSKNQTVVSGRYSAPERRKRRTKLRAVAVIGGLGKTLLRARSRDMVVDLAAGKSLFVHKDDFKPGFGYDAGGAQPAGPAPMTRASHWRLIAPAPCRGIGV